MINKLKLYNFKCFKNIELEFVNMNILAGGNGVGKSSIIQSLQYLDNIVTDNSKYYVPTSVNGVNYGLPNQILSQQSDEPYLRICPTIGNNELEFKFNIDEGQMHKYGFTVEKNIAINSFYKIFKIFYLNAYRIQPQAIYESGKFTNDYVGPNGENTVEAISSLSKRFKMKEYKKQFRNLNVLSGTRDLDFENMCSYWMMQIFDDIKLNIKDIEQSVFSELKIKNKDGFYLPTATGFGISYVLPIIAQGLICATNDNSVFIVENPEAHLHPKSQSQIGKFLATLSQNGVQVILETHSEHVINGVRNVLGNEQNHNEMSIFYFKHGESGVECEKLSINKYGELSSWPKGFFDQQECDLMEIMMRKLS